MNSTYLIHHGIKNQKWGDRNGPPYPLSASAHSSAEKSAGTSGWSKEAKANYKVERKRAKDEYKLTAKKDKYDADIKKAKETYKAEKQFNKDMKNEAKQQWKEDRKEHIKNNSSTGHQVLNVLINGPFGAYSYNSMRTAGYSRLAAEGATVLAAAITGGSGLGNIVLSSLVSSGVKDNYSRDELSSRLNKNN